MSISLGPENNAVSPVPHALLQWTHTPPVERWGSLTPPLESGQAGDALGLLRLGHQSRWGFHWELLGTPAQGTQPPQREEPKQPHLEAVGRCCGRQLVSLTREVNGAIRVLQPMTVKPTLTTECWQVRSQTPGSRNVLSLLLLFCTQDPPNPRA